MPYDTLDDLPDAVKKLPKHGQEIYQKAYNSAFKQYKGDEGKSAGTAWAAVKMKYKQDADGNWVAKESKEVATMESKSYENTRMMLDAALHTHLNLARDEFAYVEDFTETEIFYNRDRQSYKAPYSVTGEIVTIGDAVKVARQVTYKALEALQPKYAELIQEIGKRNAALDATRVKKILQLCQELLSSEEPDEKKVGEAVKEVTSTLTWLREQKAMKTEEGEKYPVEAFAHVGDAEKPSSWLLRMWEDPTKKVTKTQLNKLAAALSPGGLSGQKPAIAKEDFAAVKRKIRAQYRKLGVEEDDMPKWVRETETRELLLSYVPLTEAKLDKGRATVIVIKPGLNESGDRCYPAEMLKRDYKLFEGQKMYADHPTETEDKERPERSIRDWVATLVDVICDESGVITGVAEIIEPWMQTKLASLRDKKMLSEMGISINAVGHATKGTVDGKETLIIEELINVESVDFVTEPGAGGVVTFFEANRHRNIDLMELATLKERRPDLVKAIEADVRAEIREEVKKAMEDKDRIVELEGQITTLTTERDTLKTQMEEAEKATAKAEAQATIKAAVDKAVLPDAAREKLIERFKDAESADGIDKAITAEIDYVAKIAEAGKVKGLGPGTPPTKEEKEALRESFKKLHPEWDDKQIDTAVEGR